MTGAKLVRNLTFALEIPKDLPDRFISQPRQPL
jgi:hypothetical protein